MKVTKVIREYIEDEINKLYEPKFEALKKEKNELTQKYGEALYRIEQKCIELDNELKAQIQKEFGFITDEKDFACERKMTQWRFERSDPAWKACEKAEKELQAQCDKSIRNAIVTLELGGTRSELDEMLAQIKEELN